MFCFKFLYLFRWLDAQNQAVSHGKITNLEYKSTLEIKVQCDLTHKSSLYSLHQRFCILHQGLCILLALHQGLYKLLLCTKDYVYSLLCTKNCVYSLLCTKDFVYSLLCTMHAFSENIILFGTGFLRKKLLQGTLGAKLPIISDERTCTLVYGQIYRWPEGRKDEQSIL